METAITVVLIVLVVGGMALLGARNRRRMAGTETVRREHIVPGASVMTTSGLYATVTAVYDDDSVLLAVAPGVQLRWAVAAVRPAETLPERYRPAATHSVTFPAPGEPAPGQPQDGPAPADPQTGPVTGDSQPARPPRMPGPLGAPQPHRPGRPD